MRLEKCLEEPGLEKDIECPICGSSLFVIQGEDEIVSEKTEDLGCPECDSTIAVTAEITINYITDVTGPKNFFEADINEEDVGVPAGGE